jgi:hypothetical protein
LGFLDKLLSREKEQEEKQETEKEKKLSEPRVCIPEAQRKKIEREARLKRLEKTEKQKIEKIIKEEELPEFEDEKPRFLAEGIFAVIDTMMVKGTVVSGKIKKGTTIIVDKKKFKVKDLQFEGRSVPHLLTYQKGAIFFDKAKGLGLKAGKILEFKGK